MTCTTVRFTRSTQAYDAASEGFLEPMQKYKGVSRHGGGSLLHSTASIDDHRLARKSLACLDINQDRVGVGYREKFEGCQIRRCRWWSRVARKNYACCRSIYQTCRCKCQVFRTGVLEHVQKVQNFA